MATLPIPVFCIPCLTQAQAVCPHLHTDTVGGFHFSEGEVWDDIHDVCLDCGADLSYHPIYPTEYIDLTQE